MFMSRGEEELQARTEQLERINVRLDEIMNELKRSNHKIDNLIKQRTDRYSLCCFAYARAKFKYEQRCKLTFFFLNMIAKLYRLEEEYKRLKLSPQEIYERRNDDATIEIVESIKTRLYELLANGNEVNSDLMLIALNYLRTFWKQIFAYRNDYRQYDSRTGDKVHCPVAKRKYVLRER